MALIKLSEHRDAAEADRVRVLVEYRGTVVQREIPHLSTPQDEEEIRWYLEDYLLRHPTAETRAQKALRTIKNYTDALAEALTLGAIINECFEPHSLLSITLAVQHSGKVPDRLQAIHWEVLEPQTWSNAPRVQSSANPAKSFRIDITVVRTCFGSGLVRPVTSVQKPRKKVLVVLARGKLVGDAAHATTLVPVIESFHDISQSNFDIVRPGTFAAFKEQLGRCSYDLVLFDLHGVEREGKFYLGFMRMFMKNKHLEFSPDEIPAQDIAQMLHANGVEHAFFGSCRSAKEMDTAPGLARLLVSEGLSAAAGMAYNTLDYGVGAFFTGFFRAYIGCGMDFGQAISWGRRTMAEVPNRATPTGEFKELHDCFVPVLYMRNDLAMDWTLGEVDLPKFQADIERRRSRNYVPYPLSGRDYEVLELETRLLMQHNVAVVQGELGVGKTWLIEACRQWWKKTGLFCVSVAFTAQDELRSIEAAICDGLGLQPGLSGEALTQYLADNRVLIIFDDADRYSKPLRTFLKGEANSENINQSCWRTCIMIVSRRNSKFGDSGFPLALEDLSPFAARGFARQRAREVGMALDTDQDHWYLQGLLETVGYNALAVDILLANVTSQCSTPKELYRSLLTLDGFLIPDRHTKYLWELEALGGGALEQDDWKALLFFYQTIPVDILSSLKALLNKTPPSALTPPSNDIWTQVPRQARESKLVRAPLSNTSDTKHLLVHPILPPLLRSRPSLGSTPIATRRNVFVLAYADLVESWFQDTKFERMLRSACLHFHNSLQALACLCEVPNSTCIGSYTYRILDAVILGMPSETACRFSVVELAVDVLYIAKNVFPDSAALQAQAQRERPAEMEQRARWAARNLGNCVQSASAHIVGEALRYENIVPAMQLKNIMTHFWGHCPLTGKHDATVEPLLLHLCDVDVGDCQLNRCRPLTKLAESVAQHSLDGGFYAAFILVRAAFAHYGQESVQLTPNAFFMQQLARRCQDMPWMIINVPHRDFQLRYWVCCLLRWVCKVLTVPRRPAPLHEILTPSREIEPYAEIEYCVFHPHPHGKEKNYFPRRDWAEERAELRTIFEKGCALGLDEQPPTGKSTRIWL